ncbi:hypothetical protein Lalb_Chr09g0324421 [Lupinus albus]|uniref:Uncharacterized protein n=1 Tax=Lupinus albus TaxID=3870 RepID=A0A6A4PZC2_LUPAL|nr:hypothetical protein Lalb_Chr09g0324421 [Lupinus albus]
MSSLPLLLLVLLFISLHACTACPFGITKKDTTKYHFHEEIDKVTLLEICESCSSTSTLKEMIIGGTSGAKFYTISTLTYMHTFTKSSFIC